MTMLFPARYRAVPALAAGLLFAALAAPAPAQQPIPAETRTRTAPPAGLPETQKFVRDAAAANRFEIEAAELALQRAGSDDVRRYARDMIDAHRLLAAEMPAATASRADPAAVPLSARESRTLERLRQASGSEFDRLYADSQVLGHRRAIEMHRDYLIDGTDPEVKSAARRAIPRIEQHLRDAQLLQQQIAVLPAQSAPSDRSPSGQMTPRHLQPGEQAPLAPREPSRMPPGQLP